MKRRHQSFYTNLLLAAIVGVLYGLFANHSFISFAIVGIFIICVDIVIFVVGLLVDDKVILKMSAIIFACLSMSFISFFFFFDKKMDKRETNREKVILKLRAYKQEQRVYPLYLSELKNVDTTSLSYSPDSNRQHFDLIYSSDGWHYQCYSSKNERFILD